MIEKGETIMIKTKKITINKTTFLLTGTIFFGLLLSACQTPISYIPEQPAVESVTPLPLEKDQMDKDQIEKKQIKEKQKIEIKQFKNWPIKRSIIKAALIEMLEDWGEPAFEVDDVLVRHVSYFYKYYSVINYKRSNRAIKRSHQYLPYIIKVFKKYRLPEDIAFALPFVESSFNPKARSGVGAAGMFQFMKATGRQYGLKVSRSIDERLDPYKAAPASARYLRNNRNVFASSVLSLGSYHHGTGKVSQVLLSAANADDRRFGPIFTNKRLGRYSKEYIPQCLSAALMYRFMKSMGISSLPEMSFKIKKISKKILVDNFENSIPDLYDMNPDLTKGVQTYSYASTKGYMMISSVNIGKINLSKIKAFPKESTQPINEPPVIDRPAKSYQWPSNPSTRPSGKSKVSGRSKYIRYVFQQGNQLRVIADIFETSVQKLKQTKENRYLKKRNPRPGDVIRIEGLSPTTQKIGGGGYVCGHQKTLITRNRESIESLCKRIQRTIHGNCRKTNWKMGTDISPALIYYWNTDVLEDIGPKTPLSGGIPLVVYTDYLWYKKKITAKNKTTSKQSIRKSSQDGRRTGSKFVTYRVQNQNIRQGNLIQQLSTIFHVTPKELMAWNPKLKIFKRNPEAWVGKYQKLYIKNCPVDVQKFGNPGIVCGKGKDTRLTIGTGESLYDVAEKAKNKVLSCGGRGKGITPQHILYWNADVLSQSGISNINDSATRPAKLTIYVNFY